MAILLFVGSAVFYWAGNDRTSLWDRDEPRFAQPAKEMLFAENLRDWIVPHMNGQPHFHKPPWCYWQIALADTVFGINEFSARFFSGLWTAVGAVLVFCFLRRWSHRAGLVASVTMLSSLLVVVMAKMAISDATLLLLTLLAVFTLWRRYSGDDAVYHRLVFWISIGIAGLVKGPAIFVVLVPLAFGLLVVDKNRRWVLGWDLLWGLPLALAIAMPWYILAEHLASGGLVERFVGFDILERLRRPVESHGGPPGFYAAAGLINLWPWSAFLVPVAIFAVRRRSEKIVKFLLCWLVLPTVALELISTKMVHYWLGILPAYCLLLGLAAECWFERSEPQWQRWSVPVRTVIVVVYALLAIGMLVLSKLMFGRMNLHMSVMSIGLFLVSVMVYFAARRSLAWTIGATAAGVGITILIASTCVLPAMEQYKFGKQLADVMIRSREGDRRFALIRWDQPSTIFYLHNGRDNVLEGTLDDFVRWAASQKLVAAMPVSEYRRLLDREPDQSLRFNKIADLAGYDYTRGAGLKPKRVEFVVVANEIGPAQSDRADRE